MEEDDLTALEPNGSWPLVKCSQGWEYNTSVVWSSIVIDVRSPENITRSYQII